MVKSLIFIKSKHFLKKMMVSAITVFVVAFYFSSSFVSAAEMKISEQEVVKIKIALGIIGTASDIGSVLVDGGNLMTVLKTTVKGGGIATDATYGLLVLSAINEMEFMDLVLSQDYKDISKEYFNGIVDERTNLTSYWKGVGFDIPRVVSGQITGPMGALTLNTFEMTDKIILILSAFNNLKTEIRYDGLWYYFDFRRGGDTHKEAWEMVEIQMGFAAKSTSLWGTPRIENNNQLQLETQFAALYEKWGPYATPNGISKEYKEQLASELRNTLTAAIEERTEDGPLYVKEPSVWEKFTAQLASIKNTLANLVSQVKNPFSAGPVVELTLENPAEVFTDARPLQTEDRADIGFPPNSSLPTTTEPITVDIEPEIEMATTTEAEIIDTRVSTTTEVVVEKVAEDGPPQALQVSELCQRSDGGLPRRYRALINEVAWMGGQDSSSDEWIVVIN